jgi:hypothetical protein
LPAGFGGYERRQTGQESLADQQQANSHQQHGDRALKVVIRDTPEQPHSEPCGGDAAESKGDHGRGESTNPDKRAGVPAHNQRRGQSHEAENLIHRHGRARGEPDQPDQKSASGTRRRQDRLDRQCRRSALRRRERSPLCASRQRQAQQRRTPALSRGFEDPRFCKRLQDAFRDPPWTFSQPEHRRLVAARIDLDNLCAQGNGNTVARQTSEHARDRRR